LEALLPANEEMAKANKDKLLHKEFQFKYITHTYTNKKGNTYFFCYEYGYLPLENDWFLIVREGGVKNFTHKTLKTFGQHSSVVIIGIYHLYLQSIYNALYKVWLQYSSQSTDVAKFDEPYLVLTIKG